MATRRRTARRCTGGSIAARHLRRQDRAEAGAGEGRDALVHAARPGRGAAIEADSRLHPREVEGARVETRQSRRGARSDRRTDAQTARAQRCAGVPHPAAAARPQISDASRAALHGGDRSRRARAGLQTHQGTAPLEAAARDEEGDPLCLRSVSGRRTAKRTARPELIDGDPEARSPATCAASASRLPRPA